MLFDFTLILLYGETLLTTIFVTPSFLAAPVCLDHVIEQNRLHLGIKIRKNARRRFSLTALLLASKISLYLSQKIILFKNWILEKSFFEKKIFTSNDEGSSYTSRPPHQKFLDSLLLLLLHLLYPIYPLA